LRRVISTGLGAVVGAALLSGCQGKSEKIAIPAPPAAFAACKTCHNVGPNQSAAGPSLWGVAGRQAGAAPGFQYSPAMRDAGFSWDRARLVAFLTNPGDVVPGTKMLFAGYDNPQDAEAVADYLMALK
jgi:cytochrome c